MCLVFVFMCLVSNYVFSYLSFFTQGACYSLGFSVSFVSRDEKLLWRFVSRQNTLLLPKYRVKCKAVNVLWRLYGTTATPSLCGGTQQNWQGMCLAAELAGSVTVSRTSREWYLYRADRECYCQQNWQGMLLSAELVGNVSCTSE